MTLNKLLAGIALTATLALNGCLVYETKTDDLTIKLYHNGFENSDRMVVIEDSKTTTYDDYDSDGEVDKVTIIDRSEVGKVTSMVIKSNSPFGEENLAKFTSTYQILFGTLNDDVTLNQETLVGPYTTN